MTIQDLAGLSKPLEKLIASVSNGIGVLYEPVRIQRQATAEAQGELIRAEAELQKIALFQRAAQRINFRELRAQVNIDNIVSEASKFLPDSVNDEPVDPDWLLRFFDDCQSISDEDMQSIWGKILAGEVATPGRYSRITLSILKNVSKDDATLLEATASLAWDIHGPLQAIPYTFIPVEFNVPTPLSAGGIAHDDCIHLSALGLINVSKDLFLQVVEGSTATYFDHVYKVYLSNLLGVNGGNLNIFSFTRSGKELLPFLNRSPNSDWESTSISRMSRMLNAEFHRVL